MLWSWLISEEQLGISMDQWDSSFTFIYWSRLMQNLDVCLNIYYTNLKIGLIDWCLLSTFAILHLLIGV